MSQGMKANPDLELSTEPPVARAYNQLKTSVSDLDEEIKAFIVQLAPVLNPDFPDIDPGDAETKMAPRSELATVLFIEVGRIREITQALNSVRNRLEV